MASPPGACKRAANCGSSSPRRETSATALSPDGKMLAYVQGSDSKQDLYVSRLAGGEHLRLTNDGAQKDDPQFSPDGEKIVFVRHDANSNQPELCLIPALGGNVVPLLPWAENPSWSRMAAGLPSL